MKIALFILCFALLVLPGILLFAFGHQAAGLGWLVGGYTYRLAMEIWREKK